MEQVGERGRSQPTPQWASVPPSKVISEAKTTNMEKNQVKVQQLTFKCDEMMTETHDHLFLVFNINQQMYYLRNVDDVSQQLYS